MDEIAAVETSFGFLDHVPIGMAVLRQDSTVLFWNSVLEDWTGIAKNKIVGANIGAFFPHFSDPLYTSRLANVFVGGPPVVFSSQFHKHMLPSPLRDGQLRIQHTIVTSVPGLNGSGFYALVSIQDVTDLTHRIQAYRVMRDQAVEEARQRKLAEDAALQYAGELEKRNEELDEFSHTVAHDLKSPLSSVIGYTELLSECHDSMSAEDQAECLTALGHTASKMNSIITELLLLAQVRRADVETKPLDMAGIVAEAHQRLISMAKTYQAEISLPPAWPVAAGYGPWIEEVWVNYLSNAFKYGGQPPRVELGADLQPDGTVRFWVRDNGPGLTPKAQARLFTPFTRLDQARAKGHGLGLSIVRRIVEKLGGKVGVESQIGTGSLFSFTLPAATAGQTADVAAERTAGTAK